MLHFDLQPNEKILLVVRKHWIAIIGELMVFFFAAIVPLVLVIIALVISNGEYSGYLAAFSYLIVFAHALWLLFFWIMFFFAWTKYYLDVWIVTNHRIFTIDQKGMFEREVSSFTLDKIQDLTIEVNGFLATMLKFGTISIETAADNKEFVLTNARNPEAIKITINDIQKKFYTLSQPIEQVKE